MPYLCYDPQVKKRGDATQGCGRNDPSALCSRKRTHPRRGVAGLSRRGRQVQPGLYQSRSLCQRQRQGGGLRQQPRRASSAFRRRRREVRLYQLREAAGTISQPSAGTPPREGADMKLKINTDGFEGYAKRALERARKLDRREAIKPEITITFEDPLAMVEVLTAERLRLVQKVRTISSSITALAAALKRDPKSVRRDVLKLERAGVVRTREQINPGHGRVKIVEPVARKYHLTAVL